MIGSLRGVAILAAVAVISIALALLDGRVAPRDRALVPGLDIASIAQLAGPGFALVRKGAAFAWRAPVGDVDAGTLDRLFTALRGGRWHRRSTASAAGAVRGTLAIETPDGAHAIALGQPLLGADQVWLVIDGEALLVDSWVEAALFPPPLELRVRRPFVDVEAASSIEVRGDGVSLVFDGTPALTHVRLAPDVALRLAPAIVARIASALGALESIAIPPVSPAPAAQGLAIRTSGAHAVAVAAGGTCAGELVWLGTTAGGMCVAPAAWADVVASIAMLRGPAAELVDRRPAAGARQVTLVDGTRVDLGKVAAGFDPVRLAALAAALAAPAALATGAAAPAGTLDVDGQPLALYADGSVARAGEPVRLLPDSAARALLRAGGEAFRDPRLWDEEPTTIAAVMIDNQRFTRGATLGEWAGATDPATLDALVAQLAAPTALGPASAFAERAHLVTVRVVRPDGATREHVLALDAACRGTTDDRSVQLPVALCRAVQRAH